jgi:hypothetical protein
MAATTTKQAHEIGPLRAVVRMVDEHRITEPYRRYLYVYLLSCGHTVTRTMKGRRKCACDSCGAHAEHGPSQAP